MRSRFMMMRRGFFLLIALLAIFAMLELIRRANNELISKNTGHTKEKMVVIQPGVELQLLAFS